MKQVNKCPKCGEYPVITLNPSTYTFWLEHFCFIDNHFYKMEIDAWNKRS